MAHISSGLGKGVCADAALQQNASIAAEAVLPSSLAKLALLYVSATKMPASAPFITENGS